MSILKTKTSLKIDCLVENTFGPPTEIFRNTKQRVADQRGILWTGQSKEDTQIFSGYATQ